MKNRSKIDEQIHEKSTQNRSKMNPKSSKNRSWGSLGAVLGAERAHIAFGLGILWHSGGLGRFWGRLGGVLGLSWMRLGGVLGRLGTSRARLGGVLERLRGLLGRHGGDFTSIE